MIRLAVDIGGTFTDVVLDVDGRLFSNKVLSTIGQPESGAIDGISALLESHGLELKQVQSLIHGTTLATNALIERTGAKTALITTQGFRDVLEMRNEKRFDQYSLNIQLPEPLVPRDRRFTINERILVDGTVLSEPQDSEIAEVASTLRQLQVEAVAIGFLHSYKYPAHEQYVASELESLLPDDVTVCQSADVANEIREFDRFSTVCANAYVRPLMSSYLNRFHETLTERGFEGAFLLMLSGGGLTTLEQATHAPIRLLESGPAGGAQLASHVSKEVGSPRVLSLDIGGTTAKICFIEYGKPQTTRRFEVARAWKGVKGSGLPVRVPTIELVEIGAGGGSIARVDSLGRLAVGPDSAGSEPGPCAYGRGGTLATVTDAHITVGSIDTRGFAGGVITLSPEDSNNAITQQLATPLGLKFTETAAAGVIEIADEMMANAARVHGIELGKNIGQFHLLVSGGGGALHATRIAEKLGIEDVIVPQNAGVGSAIGFLHTPVAYEIAVTVMQPLDSLDQEHIEKLLRAAESQASSIVSSVNSATILNTYLVAELRYIGQDFELSFDIDLCVLSDSLTKLKQRFTDQYSAMHGFILSGVDIELIGFSVTVSAEQEIKYSGNRKSVNAASLADEIKADHSSKCSIDGCLHRAQTRSQAVYDLKSESVIRYSTHDRDSLTADYQIEGPAIIKEAQTTTLIPTGWKGVKLDSGHLLLRRVQGLRS